MKNYYHILNITERASQQEIKRAFRLLAVKYHPDKNPDPSAEIFFKEINEAYEVLGDPVQRAQYDLLIGGDGYITAEVPSAQRRTHRDPAYKRKDPSVKVKSERQRMLEMMEPYVPRLKKVINFSLAVSIFLMLDFLLPNQVTIEKVLQLKVTRNNSKHSSVAMVKVFTHTGKIIEVPYEYSPYLERGTMLEFESSRLLHIPRYITTNEISIHVKKSIYGNFAFGPLALFATAVFGWYYRWRVDYVFNAGVVSFLLLLLNLVFFLILH